MEGRPGESLHYVARLKPGVLQRPAVETAVETPLNPLPSLVAELGEPGVSPPRKLSGEFARYPEVARRRRVSGVVTVSMVISEVGLPEDLQVIESGGPLLDEAVLNAVAEWRFEPASRDGRPVPTQVPNAPTLPARALSAISDSAVISTRRIQSTSDTAR